MAAEIRVDRITSRTGINTISLTGDGFSYLTNLGVGTTQPTSKLHVVGDTLITGVSTFTGDSTFSGNVTIGGTITYQDVKHIDAVGIITAQQGIQVLANGLNITGVSTFGGNVDLGDNVKAKFGDAGDLEIYHDSTNSIIEDVGTGNLMVKGANVQLNSDVVSIKNNANDENLALFNANGSVQLFYDNAEKLNTKSDGINVTGEVQGDSLDIDGTANIQGSLTVQSDILMGDNDLLKIGDADDLQISHNGTVNIIDGRFHPIEIRHQSEVLAKFNNNGSVELYYDNTKRLNTADGGVVVTGVVTATSFSGDGSALTGIAAGGSGEFNTGITSTVKFTPLGYESTMFTFPTTSGYQYVVDSINVANVSDTVGIGTSINIIVSIANTNGTSERTHIAYNIPIADGGLVELLKNPFVASPGDVMRAWTTRGSDYVGLSSCANIYMNYTGTADSTDYVTGFASTIGIQTGQVNTGFYTSFTYPSNLQSIRLTNRTDDGDYPVSVSIKTGATTSYLVKDLIIPRYASVDILARQKRIEINDIVQVSVGATSTIDIILAGKKITS